MHYSVLNLVGASQGNIALMSIDKFCRKNCLIRRLILDERWKLNITLQCIINQVSVSWGNLMSTDLHTLMLINKREYILTDKFSRIDIYYMTSVAGIVILKNLQS